MSIIIDKEFESLIPPLTPEEFAQLEENCVKEGIRDALIVWKQDDGNDILIDGHNRFRISAKHAGIMFDVKKMEFADRDAAKRWIILNQFGRRNLSAYDRSILALKLKPIIAEKAKERQNLGLKSDEGGRTDDALGKIAGVGKDTIRKVETIERKATPEAKQQIRDGKKSINAAFNEIKERERKQIDLSARAHLEKTESRHEDFKSSKVVGIAEVAQDKKDSIEIARNKSHEIFDAIKKILFISAGGFDYSIVSAKTIDKDELLGLQGQLDMAIATLTEIKNQIGG
jgi:hypothetical protein